MKNQPISLLRCPITLRAISSKTKAIMLVQTFTFCCFLDKATRLVLFYNKLITWLTFIGVCWCFTWVSSKRQPEAECWTSRRICKETGRNQTTSWKCKFLYFCLLMFCANLQLLFYILLPIYVFTYNMCDTTFNILIEIYYINSDVLVTCAFDWR